MKVIAKVLEDRARRRKNAARAEGAEIASKLLKGLADSVVDGEYQDMRRGLLVAAGFTSVLSSAIESGSNEIAFIDVDGVAIPVDLKLTIGEGS